jgi:hypothetical protein
MRTPSNMESRADLPASIEAEHPIVGEYLLLACAGVVLSKLRILSNR